MPSQFSSLRSVQHRKPDIIQFNDGKKSIIYGSGKQVPSENNLELIFHSVQYFILHVYNNNSSIKL